SVIFSSQHFPRFRPAKSHSTRASFFLNGIMAPSVIWNEHRPPASPFNGSPAFPHMLRSRLEKLFQDQLQGGSEGPFPDFTRPAGEPALSSPGSVSWTVFGNPVSLFIGGITAVLLELAEPKVRSGVWDHTSFRTDPLKRMRRTGLAAMVTVY